MEYDLICCVMSCDTIPKYNEQIKKINETWYNNNTDKVKTLFFLGEEVVLSGSQYIHLKGVKNDYESCCYKQNLGLKYIHENYKYKFVIMLGTDTYINIPKLLNYLSQWDHTIPLYMGDPLHRNIFGGKEYDIHGGGCGIVLSYGIMEKIYPYLENLHAVWTELRGNNGIIDCDNTIGWIALCNGARNIVIPGFYPYNYKDRLHDLQNLITCHLMSSEDFDTYTKLLKENNYYV